MDVQINSQIQSPLVRALARTKGKSQSFTHNISDNVPPVSLTKIQLSAQQGETELGRSYKIKIPQFGYLREAIMKYTVREGTVDPQVVGIAQGLYASTSFTLDDVRIGGSNLNRTNPQNAADISWYYMQNMFLANSSNGATSSNLDIVAASDCKILAPQFDRLYIAGTTPGTISTVTNQIASVVSTDTGHAGVALTTTSATMTGAAAAAGPYTQYMNLNGNPAMWSAFLRFYYNIYQLSTASGAKYTIAKMIWEQLKNEPTQTITKKIYTTPGLAAGVTETAGVVSQTTSTVSSGIVGNSLYTSVNCTLPKFVVGVARAGEIYWIPKLPQLQYDSTGALVGVTFVPLHLLHPNDNADSTADLQFWKLSATSTSKPINYRAFSLGTDFEDDDDWNAYDWQTESFYYDGFAANIAERVQLSSHNRPIQTVFPQESFARIQTLPSAERQRMLAMMQPRVSQQGKCTADNSGTPGEKVMYMPLLLSSTENPSLNFDTRFVEQLDIDVVTRPLVDLFSASDINSAITSVYSVQNWVDYYRSNVFNFDWGTGPSGTIPGSAQVATVSTATDVLLSALQGPNVIVGQSASYETYAKWTPRSFALSLRGFSTGTAANYVKVECLAYFTNFHDATAQAIRDSNFKPGVPASILGYNTYAESDRLVKATELNNTTTINIPITCNNLVSDMTFFVRRRRTTPLYSNKRDGYMQTLPIKSVTLTGSGQQLYTANFEEAQLADLQSYPLASGVVGRPYNRSYLAQALTDPVTGEKMYIFKIPFGLSSDMTYNSGSIALQTINNPVLSITVDVGSGASQPFEVLARDDEWVISVFHNFWNMIRIDSNTGAITRSLDL